MTSFSAQVAAEIAQIKNGLDMIVLQSAQDVLNDASRPVAQGGNLPVDTGHLRNSLAVAINAEPTTSTGPEVTAQIAGFEIGDTIMARWTANYATYVEYGSRGRAGRAFVRQAAQKWQAIVTKNANVLLARFNGR